MHAAKAPGSFSAPTAEATAVPDSAASSAVETLPVNSAVSNSAEEPFGANSLSTQHRVESKQRGGYLPPSHGQQPAQAAQTALALAGQEDEPWQKVRPPGASPLASRLPRALMCVRRASRVKGQLSRQLPCSCLPLPLNRPLAWRPGKGLLLALNCLGQSPGRQLCRGGSSSQHRAVLRS